jgi:hypothetical protein
LLLCGRAGFSFPDGEFLKDASGLSTSFAYELLVRRVQKIVFSEDLYQEDLLEFVKILSLSPEVIQQAGGIDALMAKRGIRSIWVNEFDLPVIRKKRLEIEQSGVIPQGIDETEAAVGTAPVVGQQSPQPDVPPPDHQLQELIERLKTCVNEDIYLMLVRQAVACADNLQSRQEQHLVFPLIELLSSNACDEKRSESIRGCAQFAIEQIITTGEMLQIVLDRIEQGNGLSDMALQTALKAGGVTAITATVDMMGRANSFKTRKTIITALVSLGEAALPVLLDSMHDSRWFIIRNICAILGSIANREALSALSRCMHHPDLRVRKEAIRSLALLGGQESETSILGILRGMDTALHPQAIASLGGMKSRKSLPELIKILFSRDLFLKSLTLKLDTLTAIAMIGDRQVTPHLVALLDERYLLASARGKQLKIAAALCLGKLGDVRAVPALEKLASEGGELGSACSDAIVMIEK